MSVFLSDKILLDKRIDDGGVGKLDKSGTENHNVQENVENASFMEKLVWLISKSKGASIVYGDPIDRGDKQVVPVSRVRITGGGGGSTHGEKAGPNGGGGGGYASVKPLGVYEIDKQKTTFKPVYDLNFLVLILSILTFGLTLINRKSKKR
ncbi:spore germination protein GerW family protein [Sporolactobacillus shoreicorticis]|uniref:Spore germination protein GerW family protein n=1 Tax=Sporolactobacillus shoreicorticis TaxID=1923877 RepID=A0ABW5S3S6_9BACL|nr:spore germination protein GerW family protein [Sporolactobacillus shoreicorticis]MCO7127657.1 spore germination protein GerW family protein [Sporolactobacillus shoreicorticis]